MTDYTGPERRECPFDKCTVEEVVKKTVAEMMGHMGYDINDPRALQTHHANTAWVYRMRKISEKAGALLILAILGAGIVWAAAGKKLGLGG